MSLYPTIYTLTFLTIFSISSLIGQNEIEFFRSLPSQASLEKAPNWAQLMYSSDPLVYEVIDAYQEYYAQNSFVKTIHTQNYKRWTRFAEANLSAEGKIRQKDNVEAKALRSKPKGSTSQKSLTGSWTSIGPFETYKNGTTQPISHQANVYSIDQALYDSNKLICGTESGGIFMTTDKAATWTLISKDAPFAGGMTAVALHPTDQDLIYVACNKRLYESTDNGTTWAENFYLDGGVDEIKFDPSDSDHIFLAGSKGLHESNDGGSTWSQIFSERVWDLDFHPTNSDIIYLLKSNANLVKSEFYKSEDNGSTWTLITNGWYVPEVQAEAGESGGKIGVSIDAPDRVYAALIGSSKANDNGWIGIFRSEDAGDSWTLPAGQTGGPYAAVNTMPWNAAAYTSGYHQGYYNFDLEVSPNNADLLWFGTVRLSESADGGASYVSIGAANSTRLSDQHADIQAIHVDGNDIWVASDGGINYSNDNLQSHSSKKYGIIAANFWGFAGGWNEDVLVGGKYHNGNTAYYQSYGTGLTHNVGGVEEATGYVNPYRNRKAHFSQGWSGHTVSKVIADNLGGATTNESPINILPNESYFNSYSSGIYHFPLYADQMLAGKDSIIWKSVDGGAQWNELHDFGKGRVLEIEISRANNDVIYAVFQPNGGYWDQSEIHRSVDGGTTWTKLTNLPTQRRRIQITTNPLDADEIWAAAVHGTNNNKVFMSTDGGINWNNKTTALLDDQRIDDIRFHGGSTECVYIVTPVSFYYHDTGDWIEYDTGLPALVRPQSMQLFYRDKKIRLATYGRGIWEVDMPNAYPPIAQAIAKTDSLFCSRDTVQLESHSIVDQVNTSWNWTITPAPAYVSDPTSRNPKVVLAAPGYYDVSLELTNDLNQNSVVVHENMLYLEDHCAPDTTQGMAIKLDQSGEYIQLPNFNLETNSFTITAWIKPEGIQNNYAAVLMNDGSTAGLNFRESNNTLGYHWPGGAWWWDSNLEVPQDVWSHVALVASPSGITLYLDGVGVSHNTSMDPVLLETMKIGSYKGWGSRNYKGEIDEVAIWNRSLTAQEIRTHRHLTKEDLVLDTAFTAYYQFNRNSASVLDKIGTHHGTANSNVNYVSCIAPFGGGVSVFHNINASGLYNFGSAMATIELGTGSYPDGEVYFSRINALPLPSLNNGEELGAYWIINNYGTNSFSASSIIRFDDPYSSPSTTAISNPAEITLITRPENSILPDWVSNCTLNQVQGEEYVFSNCNFGLNGQLFLHHCPVSYNISTPFLNNEVEEFGAYDFIHANNLIGTGADIKYRSGNHILLNPLFEVQLGALFTAEIGDCEN